MVIQVKCSELIALRRFVLRHTLNSFLGIVSGFLTLFFLLPPFLFKLVMQIPRFASFNTHPYARTHKHTHRYTVLSDSPGAPGKGKAKMEMNSAMLQVATQICICNYPQKHTRSIPSLFSLCLPLPFFPSPPPRSISFLFLSISLNSPFSSSMSISHSLCLKGFLSDAWWAN